MKAMTTAELERFRNNSVLADTAAAQFTLASGKKALNVGGGTVEIEFPRKTMLKHGTNLNTLRVHAQYLLNNMSRFAAGEYP
ncbi:MAG: hypothetical protein WC749_00860 [Dehalococcoidia bacterium]|uniref:hypothetical protein n=1 Tax=unclassified Pseudomonas TaxID=196821 RepID=UPI001472B4EA|nr:MULTISPECIES: hypothetical protein [unclassified Pseudomonas]NMX92511.1 hypothetical protein [Pseudomonas sp. WS 5086]NMY47211.1 hypothetical protein [Pseudomonas sp. WS 5027]